MRSPVRIHDAARTLADHHCVPTARAGRTLAPAKYSAQVNRTSFGPPVPFPLVARVDDKVCREADDAMMVDDF